MEPILTIRVTSIEDCTVYEWEIVQHVIGTNRVTWSGRAATLIEAARDAGNAMYDAWGYADSMGRLAVVGEKPQIISGA